MSYSLKLRQKDYCLNSSATIGSDNFFNSLKKQINAKQDEKSFQYIQD